MPAEFSLEELARAVQHWCEQHRILPANGQAAEAITERNIRYYRTLGLLDPPLGGHPKTFSDKHRLQLIAIRLYQAQGLPLRKIRDELYGRSLEELSLLQKQAIQQGKKGQSSTLQFTPSASPETWSVIPLAGEFLLISRRHRHLPGAIIERINRLILSTSPAAENNPEQNRN